MSEQPKQFNFSKQEDRKEFDALDEEGQSNIVEVVQGEVADIEKTNIILTPEQQKVKDSIESLLVNDFINEAIKIKEKSKLPEKIMQSTEIQQAIKKTIIHK